MDKMQSGVMVFLLLFATLLMGCEEETKTLTRPERLGAAMTWMYQIQDLDVAGAVEGLAATNYALLVIEPGHNFKLSADRYDTVSMLNALRTAPDGTERLILAYIDIGQAEDYRNYWQDDWLAPTATKRGIPDFLITIDPDGWSGNYPVAYWRSEWKALWLGNDGIVAQLARLGFDGIYLDWVEAYDNVKVIEAAVAENVNAEDAMILFIEELRAAGRAIIPDFLVVPQNAPYLIDYDLENNTDRYSRAIDALAVEDTWYYGNADVPWNDPQAGDLEGGERHQGDFSTVNRLNQYKVYQDRGIPVFSVDYCVLEENAATVYREARNAGLRPLATRVSLSRLTETPPANFP